MDPAIPQREILASNGFALSKTSGRSMRPLIWGGRHCVVVAPLMDEPSVGDLLMFEQNLADGSHKNIVHRLIEIRDDSRDRRLYIMRGDNNLHSERVSRDEIVGKVTEIHRRGGYRPWHVIGKRSFAVTDRAYLCYSRIWTALWPLRRLYYRLRNTLRRTFYPAYDWIRRTFYGHRP